MGRVDVVKYLVDHGAHVNIKDDIGEFRVRSAKWLRIFNLAKIICSRITNPNSESYSKVIKYFCTFEFVNFFWLFNFDFFHHKTFHFISSSAYLTRTYIYEMQGNSND